MNITTKYNVNDKIVFRDGDTKISAIIQKILVCVGTSYSEIKYITDHGVIYQDEVINNNKANSINNETVNSIKIGTMTSGLFNKSLKPKYNIGQLVEYSYRGVKYASIIESINTNDDIVTYKLKHDDRDFLEKEIKITRFDIDDNIVYFICHENDKTEYRRATIVHIDPDFVLVRDNGYLITIEYSQILRRT
jgi:hypothetical protein